MSYILFASSGGGITQPITLTADIDADDFSINNITNLTAGTTGLIIGEATDSLSFFGAPITTQASGTFVNLIPQGAAYSEGDINFSLDELRDGINNVILELQTLGLLS